MANMAKLVWAFDIGVATGKTLDTSMETGYIGGFLVCPKEFPLALRPRSRERAESIDREMDEVRDFLGRFG